MKVHVDTDLGGDPDDACALAMLLGWPDVEITGITTTHDRGGRRAGMVAEFLRIAGREDIPLAAAAGATLTDRTCHEPKPDHDRNWGRPIAPRPSPSGVALDLLQCSIEADATVIAIGGFTNLALLEVARPGTLARTHVVAMAGWLEYPSPGLPQWGPEMDWNTQCDAHAAQIVFDTANLTLTTLESTLGAQLCGADLPRLRNSGPLGELLARQSLAHAEETGMAALGKAHAALADDLLNFHYDPVACAVAVGWPGVEIVEVNIRSVLEDNLLRLFADNTGRRMRVVTKVDPADFRELWLSRVEAAQHRW